MEAHLDGISSLENRLKLMQGTAPAGTPMTGSPTVGTAPPVAAGSVTQGCAKPTLPSGAIDTAVHAQMDLITAAFACDLTRSAALQLGDANGGMDEAVPGVNQHDTTHNSGPGVSQATLSNHMKFDRWYASRWAYLLGKLDAIKEGDGTLLDNTLILFASDTSTAQGAGMDMGAHTGFRIPMWIAGGGAFAFRTGMSVTVPGRKIGPGSPTSLATEWTPHHRLLTSIAQAFGVNVDTFGGHDPGKGTLPQLMRV